MTTPRDTITGHENGSAAPRAEDEAVPDEGEPTYQDEQAEIARENAGDVTPAEEAYVAEENAAAAAGVDADEVAEWHKGVRAEAEAESRLELKVSPREHELLALAHTLGDDVYDRLLEALRNPSGAGLEITLPTEPVEINREIECEIYAYRGMRLAGSP